MMNSTVPIGVPRSTQKPNFFFKLSPWFLNLAGFKNLPGLA
jgi:hypothetical protein